RKLRLQPRHLRFDPVGGRKNVRGRLPKDVEEHSRTSIRGNDREARLEAGRDAGDVADANGNVVHARHDDRGEVVDRYRLSADERELELMVLVDESRRDDDV